MSDFDVPDLFDRERVQCPDCGTSIRFLVDPKPWLIASMQITCSCGRILEVAP